MPRFKRTVRVAPLTVGQYRAVREMYPGTLLLFRQGDMYTAVYDDAVTVSALLCLPRPGGVVTFGDNDFDANLKRLLRAGHRVAVCEQVPVTGKPVNLGVKRVVTDGTPTEGHPRG